MNRSSNKFDFTNSKGQLLSGRLELPASPRAYAVFAHCFTCSKNVHAASRISRALANQNIGVLRFDFTGLGNSEGEFSNTNYSSNLADIEMAANALAKTFEAPEILIGHSLGGTACLDAAVKIPSVRAICTIGSPAQPEFVTKLFGNQLEEIEREEAVKVQLGGRDFRIEKQFVDDVRKASLMKHMPTLGKAALIFHSPQDELVGIKHAQLIYEGLKHPKSFISLDGADHLLSNEADATFVANSISVWVKRYLDQMPQGPRVSTIHSSNGGNSELRRGEVLVTQMDRFTHEIATTDHTIIADEPMSVGGNNLGMTPYDLLLASLGACTSMTLRIYAEHKEISLRHVEVKLTHDKIHAEDCESCESDKGRVDAIQKAITVKGDLTPEQVKRLGEIADRCPVNKTLKGDKQITTRISLTE